MVKLLIRPLRNGGTKQRADACTQAGVAVMNQAGSNAGAVAEHTLGLILGLSKRIGESDRRLRRGEHFTRQDAIGFDLHGRILGIVGIGHTGTRVAQLARAFGMTVLATDPFVAPDEVARRGAEPVSLQVLLQRADVVCMHWPAAPALRDSSIPRFGRCMYSALSRYSAGLCSRAEFHLPT